MERHLLSAAARTRPKGFDELAFYAEHFDTVEVNSTFYGQPRAEVARAWAERTPAGFEFSVKLYQKFTHPKMFTERAARSLPDDARERPALLDALAQPNAADIDEFRRGIDPLASSGKLGALLAQFPASFKDAPAVARLPARLLQAFARLSGRRRAAAQELERRASATRSRCSTRSARRGCRSTSRSSGSRSGRTTCRTSKGFYYMRLHGRNAAQWWRTTSPRTATTTCIPATSCRRSPRPPTRRAQLVKKAYLYTNNHFSAKSVANAAMIKQQLGEPLDGEYPPEFVERYPELAGD